MFEKRMIEKKDELSTIFYYKLGWATGMAFRLKQNHPNIDRKDLERLEILLLEISTEIWGDKPEEKKVE